MSRYDWPQNIGSETRRDNPAARSRYNARRRRENDPEAVLRASRATPAPVALHGGPIGPAAPASGRDFLWQPLGPATLLNGQAEGNPRVSGRVNAICVHDGGLRAYAASANGGVWYTKDGGTNWVSVAGLASTNAAGILRPAQRNACGALFVDFGANEGDDLVVLGTGEVDSEMGGQPGDSEGGIGILVADKPLKSGQPDPWVREAPNLVNNGVYQIVREPGGATMIAATRTGLYQRPTAPGENRDWVRPTGTPFDTLNSDCTDLLWTAGDGPRPARLWVWVKEGDNAGLWVRDAGATNFSKVAVDGASTYSYTARRARLAASTPPTQIWVFNDRGNVANAGLFRVTNTATTPTAHAVVNVPNVLRDQGFYDIAIAVHPTSPNKVVLAGSFLGDPNNAADVLLVTTQDGATRGYDASIVVADVAPDPSNANRLSYGFPNPFKMIGIGVHPDVHALAYSNGGATLWVCCDGGIARSDLPDNPAGFYSRNNGMSISETNYIAIHPRCEGNIVAGLQDNGRIVRISNGVWKVRFKGDGGGVVMDMANPSRWMAQYVRGSWDFDPPGGSAPTIPQAENDAASFYSSAACIAHIRNSPPAASPNFSQVILGTTRLWYSDDFGMNWTPLPTTGSTAFGEAIRVCRWQSPDVAWALGDQHIKRYARTPGSHNAGGPGTWTATDVMPPGYTPSGKAKKRPPAPPSLLDAAVWTDLAVNLDPPPGPNQPPAQHGTLGAIYIGTTGNPDKPDTDMLWWFDGTDKWYPTGLRRDIKGVPAPVTSIVCTPTAPNEVWVGTTVGVWHGLRTDHGANPPTWEWQQRVNGLPEATVEDLALFSDGGLVLLRAAIASRGVWELRLDVTDVQDLVYLRAHDDDLRYRARAVEKQRDLTTDRSWHGSPDIRPRVAPAPLAAPSTLPWQRISPLSSQQLRRFQAALRSSTNDPRIVANGVWDAYFSEVLRDHAAPTVAIPAAPPLPAFSRVQIDQPFWNTHMQSPFDRAEPWGAVVPSETDLYELTPSLNEGTRNQTSCTMPASKLKVDIVVHYRGKDPIDGNNVRVTLLWWADPNTPTTARWNDVTTWVSGNVGWTAAVNQVLNSNDGKTANALDPGWKFALGDSTQSHRLTLAGQTIDPLHSGVATFDLDLTGQAVNAVILLVAIIRAGTTPADDIALTPQTLYDLALTTPNVAVRSIQIIP